MASLGISTFSSPVTSSSSGQSSGRAVSSVCNGAAPNANSSPARTASSVSDAMLHKLLPNLFYFATKQLTYCVRCHAIQVPLLSLSSLLLLF